MKTPIDQHAASDHPTPSTHSAHSTHGAHSAHSGHSTHAAHAAAAAAPGARARATVLIAPAVPVAPVPCSPLPEHNAAQYRAAFAATAADRAALAEDKLLTINIDIPSAVLIALAAMPGLVALRQAIVADLPNLPIESLDKLETYTLALGNANARFLSTSSTPPDSVPQLVAEAIALREELVFAAGPLARANLVSSERLAQIHTTNGYRDAATDLMVLSEMYRGPWDRIHNQTTVTMAKLDRADTLSAEINAALAQREQHAIAATEATGDRQRAYTLFVNAYDQVRRAVTFLRWNEGDANEIAPTLYSRSGGSNRNKDATPTTPASPADPAAPTVPAAPAAGSPPAHATPASPASSANAKPAFVPGTGVPEELIDHNGGPVPDVGSPFLK